MSMSCQIVFVQRHNNGCILSIYFFLKNKHWSLRVYVCVSSVWRYCVCVSMFVTVGVDAGESKIEFILQSPHLIFNFY